MVKRKEKLRATEYISEQLEESGLYDIINCDYQHVLAKEKKDITSNPRTVDVLIANLYTPVKEFEHTKNRDLRSGFYVCPILYKDGETAFVRLVDGSAMRKDKSLKRYKEHQILGMISLRAIEKAVLDCLGGNKLTYYQPSNLEVEGRLGEILREFVLKPVILDYSHIDRDHHAYDFVENRESIDYKIPEETQIIKPAAKFIYRGGGYTARLVPADIKIYSSKLVQDEFEF